MGRRQRRRNIQRTPPSNVRRGNIPQNGRVDKMQARGHVWRRLVCISKVRQQHRAKQKSWIRNVREKVNKNGSHEKKKMRAATSLPFFKFPDSQCARLLLWVEI